MVEMRQQHKRYVDEFFQCYRHQHLTASDRWLIPLLEHMEDTIWTDTAAGGDIWNGRWTPQLLTSLLGDASQLLMERRDCQRALSWLQRLTGLLQKAQRAIYGVRHAELTSLEAKIRRATVISMHQKRKIHTARTLFAVGTSHMSNLHLRDDGHSPLPSLLLLQLQRACFSPHCPTMVGGSNIPRQELQLPRWSARKTHMRKHRQREEHRSSKLKLRKLRNILMLCR